MERLRTETKMTRREIHAWFADRRKRAAAEKKREEAELILLGEEDGEEMEGKPKVNPIKINLKMLKVTEANGKAEEEGPDNPAPPQHHQPAAVLVTSRSPAAAPAAPPRAPAATKATVIRGKKTMEQLEMLKQVYVRTQWPSAAQYDELISGTALPRPEVVRWFGDCRYMQKNGQLKWLEAYQTSALAQDSKKGNVQVLQAHLDVHGRLEETQVPTEGGGGGVGGPSVDHLPESLRVIYIDLSLRRRQHILVFVDIKAAWTFEPWYHPTFWFHSASQFSHHLKTKLNVDRERIDIKEPECALQSPAVWFDLTPTEGSRRAPVNRRNHQMCIRSV